MKGKWTPDEAGGASMKPSPVDQLRWNSVRMTNVDAVQGLGKAKYDNTCRPSHY